MDISQVHNEAINEYIDDKLKDKHLLESDINSYDAFRIKQLAKNMFYAGYKDALETEKLEENPFELENDVLERFNDLLSNEFQKYGYIIK